MIKACVLNEDEHELEYLLNSEKHRIKHLNISCDKKTSVTIVVVDYVALETPQSKKRTRKIQRFHLLDGEDESLNQIIQSKKHRVIRRHDFLTESGVVVVLDYEYKRV